MCDERLKSNIIQKPFQPKKKVYLHRSTRPGEKPGKPQESCPPPQERTEKKWRVLGEGAPSFFRSHFRRKRVTPILGAWNKRGIKEPFYVSPRLSLTKSTVLKPASGRPYPPPETRCSLPSRRHRRSIVLSKTKNICRLCSCCIIPRVEQPWKTFVKEIVGFGGVAIIVESI